MKRYTQKEFDLFPVDNYGRTTYFFHMCDDSIYVRCGCFSGTIDAWENRVKKTHGFNRYAQAYAMIGAAVRAICQK